MYELKGCPQPPKRTALGALRRKRGAVRAEAREGVLGKRGARAVRVGRSIRRGGRSGGASLFARLFRKIASKVGLRPPSLRSLFRPPSLRSLFRQPSLRSPFRQPSLRSLSRKKSSGDGRNHSFTGVKKRNGRTGFAGR